MRDSEQNEEQDEIQDERTILRFHLVFPLTKLEILAGMALQGLLANPNNQSIQIQAFAAVQAANALITALEMPPKK